jgi:metallo-beta-lactamase class B
MRLLTLLLTLITAPLFAAPPADWTTPLEPFHIAGNLYYVGSRDLASYLLVTPAGNILITSNLESSPPLIRHSVEQLGFKWNDTKILLGNHAHYDHVAGAAQVLRETHAKYAFMDSDVDVVQSGGATSFDLPDSRFPVAHVDRILHDKDKIVLGGTTVVAHKTAGHTQGCTTFTLQVIEAGKPLNVVIVGGWSSNPGVRYVASHGKAPSYPGIVSDFQHTFATLHALPVDIFLGAHGVYFNMLQKLNDGGRTHPQIWVDPDGYKQALAQKEAAFQKELEKEKAEAGK